MPKRTKSGPPYTDIPGEIYIVVTNPWGARSNPRSRSQGDFDRVASWAQLVLQQGGLGGGRLATIECIYSMGTRDEIILQFQEGTDIIPLLGEHRWANIEKNRKGPPNDPRSTCVFIYNWRNNGDPANHNWTENFPKCLPLDNVPARSPYPAPSWIQPPSTLTSLVQPTPRPAHPLPPPNGGHNPCQEQQVVIQMPSPASPQQRGQPESVKQSVEQDPASTNLFRPYEPPSHHPSHTQFLNGWLAARDETSSGATPPPPKFIKKLDPYELDEDALNALHAPDLASEDTKVVPDEDIKPIAPISIKLEYTEVKIEDEDAQCNVAFGSGSGYEPSQALVDAVNSLPRPEPTPSAAREPTRDPRRRPNGGSRTVPGPSASAKYQPSAELKAETNNLLLGTTKQPDATSRTIPGPLASAGYQPSAEPEAEIDGLLQGMTRQPNAASHAVPPASLGYQPSTELEAEVNSLLLGTMPTTSSLSNGTPRSISGVCVTVIKREYEEDLDVFASLGDRKKIKREEY